ncbi:hypothetical protein P691DRAFT_777281 [Macrolepiota fuliginosa MF-IS2]|uniref:F-box domain-containing protein n=1 Tax=Macrolepiota fuliginosa MF-IS2 TaxID=1400762 RepID=A0A9P5X8W9_9AGAR|nr:hypothetical protein P691DRAFT_777281 [Macrolepiota fuliginosa MF-IS2]
MNASSTGLGLGDDSGSLMNHSSDYYVYTKCQLYNGTSKSFSDPSARIASLPQKLHLPDPTRMMFVMSIMALRKLNYARSRPNLLPHELVASIFHFACPLIDFNKYALCEMDDEDMEDEDECFRNYLGNDHDSNTFPEPRNERDLHNWCFPLVIGTVCSHWREVAWATPELWTTFSLEVITLKLEAQVSLLRLYLTNAGSLPFSLGLDMGLQQVVYIDRDDRQAPFIEFRGSDSSEGGCIMCTVGRLLPALVSLYILLTSTSLTEILGPPSTRQRDGVDLAERRKLFEVTSLRQQHYQQAVYIDRDDRQAPFIEFRAIEPLTRLIFDKFPNNIHTLRATDAPPTWMAYLSELRLPNLRDLAFCRTKDLEEVWSIDIRDGILEIIHEGVTTNPLLDDLLPILRPLSPMPPLTTLHLHGANIDVCAKMLYYCQHLVEFYCYYPIIALLSSSNTDLFKGPFVRPNLKRFGWTSQGEDIWAEALLENVRMPSLEDLQWSGFPDSDLSIAAGGVIYRFLSRLPNTLRSLSFDYRFDSGFRLLSELLSAVPPVYTLGFNNCSMAFLISVLLLLSKPTNHIGSRFLLPCLDTIILRKYTDARDRAGVAFVEMLEKRRLPLGISSFRFEAVDCEVTWSLNALYGLSKLAEELYLTIVEKSKDRVYTYFTEREICLFSQV